MPYIPKSDRQALEDVVETAGRNMRSPGELNYLITMLIKHYTANSSSGISYTMINDIVGALEGAKLEFYARVVRPYEDQKIKENGDVY